MKKLTLETLQHVVEQWFAENQGTVSGEEALLATQRELGKLIDSHLRAGRYKANETDRIRWERTTQKKIGDVLISLARYCALKNWEIDECAEGSVHILTDRTWQELNAQAPRKTKMSPKTTIKIRKPNRVSAARKKKIPTNTQKQGKVLPFRSRLTQESQIPQLDQPPVEESPNKILDPKDPLNIALQALNMVIQGDKFVKENDDSSVQDEGEE